MKVEQIYTGCLAQGAYYVVSEKEALIIDPLREIKPYLSRLEKDGVQLKYILETHFHADFVSGHLDLARQTGATIVYGPGAQPGFAAHIAADNERLPLGKVSIQVLHTPGHTLESVTYLLRDAADKEVAIFSGDTLFLGDVGRPDLAQNNTITQEDLAGMLYDSLMTKIMPLPDTVTVYPAHGKGSACGKNMMAITFDTLGNQKKMNYALNQAGKADFIRTVLDGIPPPPAYFGKNVALNKGGYDHFDQVLSRSLKALSVGDFKQEIAQRSDLVILDTRPPEQFALGFIAGAINIALNGSFAPWVGALLEDVRQPLILVTEEGKEEESITRLSRVGFDYVAGYLKGGMDAWKKAGEPVDTVSQITAQRLREETDSDTVIDLRKPGEFKGGHMSGACNLPLDYINEWSGTLHNKGHFYLYCQGGYRSSAAASILKARGIHHFTEVIGGAKALASVGLITYS